MAESHKPTTSRMNGVLWGARARDWADIQEATVRAVYEAVLTRTKVGNTTQYLDAGCGAGMAANMAANRGATVSGIDAADALLAIAKSRTPHGTFDVGDLEDLPYDDNSFDVVTGFNSFQYTGNPVVALTQARRVTKPDGSVVIMTWGDPEGMEAAALVAALKPLLPPPPPGAAGPFALSNEDAIKNLASAAGLIPVELFDVESPWHYVNEDAAIRGLGSSGVAVRAVENTSANAVDDAHATAIAPFKQSDGSYLINATFRCLLARA